MEPSKNIDSAEPASPDTPPAFLQEFDNNFSRDMAVYLESLESYGDMFSLSDSSSVSPVWSESDECNQQVVPGDQRVEPLLPAVPTVTAIPASPTESTIVENTVVENEMDTEESIVEDMPRSVARTSIHRRRPVPIYRTKAYRAAIKADAHGLNKFDRLLAKMPKSKAGRKKKFVTTNMSRNALAARENRDKKKEYVEELEEGMRALNELFKKVLDELEESDLTNNSLKKAVSYYVGLIAEMKSSAFQREG